MNLFVTVVEETAEAALRAIAGIDGDHDGVEIRAERFPAGGVDLKQFRASTSKPLILTHRGVAVDAATVDRGLEAGFQLIDVEYPPQFELGNRRDRVVLSHHDFEGMPDTRQLLAGMRAHHCAHTKLAVTPHTFADNERLLDGIAPGTTVIGMGERGLYSRILAPFLGSELAFVSASDDRSAAPSQLTLRRALEIYGPDRRLLRAERVFAVVGNPAGRSLSPSIHNALFREKHLPGAYTIASVASFAEVESAFLDGKLAGLSITAPFKEDAFRFAERVGAQFGENAREAESVNTLVKTAGVFADNTDVDGFAALLAPLCGRDRKSVAVIGAGGTARAALVALRRLGMDVTIYNRSEPRGRNLAEKFGARAEPLGTISSFDGEIVINTASELEVALPLRPGMSYVEAAYGGTARGELPGVEVIEGIELLHAQAVRQHELFTKVFDGS